MRAIWSFPESVWGLLCAFHDHLDPHHSLWGQHYCNLHSAHEEAGAQRCSVHRSSPRPPAVEPGADSYLTTAPGEPPAAPANRPSWLQGTRWESPRVHLVSSLATGTPSSSNPIVLPLKGSINPMLSGPYRNRSTAPSRPRMAADEIKSAALARDL